MIVAGIIQDREYFNTMIEPHLDGKNVDYIGAVDVAGKNELFYRAHALLHLNTIPERFGFVLAEANAAGVPVIAMDLGSHREVIDDKVTGFLVENIAEAVSAVDRCHEINPTACRNRVETYFSIPSMVEGYEKVYATIFSRSSRIK